MHTESMQETVLLIDGMMCVNCERHVKKAIEAIDGIESAVASHEGNTVTITSSKDVDMELVKKAVTDAGYQYGGIV